MKYSIAIYPGVEVEGVVLQPPTIVRQNDGAMTIMRGDPDGEDYTPALMVPMIVRAKRGEAWKTADPEQEAFAQRVVDLLNAADPS